jgi:hypothetical protein
MPTTPEPVDERFDGVRVIEQTPDEAWADFDADVRRRLGISADEFARRYDTGQYCDPDADPDVSWLAFAYLGLRRNHAAR